MYVGWRSTALQHLLLVELAREFIGNFTFTSFEFEYSELENMLYLQLFM